MRREILVKMPTYEYECNGCGNRFESVQRMKDNLIPTEIPCAICGGNVKQIITGMPKFTEKKPQPNQDWKDFTRRLKRKNPGSDFTSW